MLNPAQIKARAFLAAYRITASITRAAASVPIERTMHYRWLQTSPGYAKAFAAAKEEAAQTLEDEAIARATVGVYEPTVYQGEFTYPMELDPITGLMQRSTTPVGVFKKSDMLLSKLLNGFIPEKYSTTKVSAEVSGPGGGPITISNAGLAALTDAELATLAALTEKIESAERRASGTEPAAEEKD